MNNFNRGDSLGSLSSSQISDYLSSIEDIEDAGYFAQGNVSGQSFFALKKPYTHTGFILGFIPTIPASLSGTAGVSAVTGIGQIQGDSAIIGKRIKISLDKFYVHDYPGMGEHAILCEFSGKNQVAGETEELRFALKFNSGDKASASLSGVPIFMGVTVGLDGISFEGRTINVSNSLDEVVLATLDSPAFKNGLALINAAQPALKPFSTLAAAAVQSTLKRKKNKQVHNFSLGLDFATGATSARLRHGSYIVIQTDDSAGWNWGDFEWNADAMALQAKAGATRIIDFNYMIFGVSEFSQASSVA
jgi:hypothetical protein